MSLRVYFLDFCVLVFFSPENLGAVGEEESKKIYSKSQGHFDINMMPDSL